MKIGSLLTVLVAASLSAQPRVDVAQIEKLRLELAEVEATTEQFRRFIPITFELDEDRHRIAEVTKKLDLPPAELRVVASEKKAPLEIHKVELTGEGSYSGAHFLIYMLGLRRPLESARFEARDAGNVRFVARFDYPVWVATETSDPPSRDPLADLRRRLDRKRAELDVVVAIIDRALIERSADALANFTRGIEEERIALTKATVGDVLTIDGVALGSSARAALERELDEATLRPARVSWSSKGRCLAFTVVTSAEVRLDAPPMERELAEGGLAFDAASAKFCSDVEAGQPRRIVVRRAGSTDPALFLKMRGVEAPDAFFILNDLFNESFIVASDVRGRIDLDAHADGSLDDLWAALETDGLRIGAKPLRRVSAGRIAPVASAAAGEPVTLTFRDAALSDVLCLLKEITARNITMSASQQSRVTIYAFELPSGLVADALTPAKAAGATDPCTIPSAARPRVAQLKLPGAAEWRIADLRVAAVAMLPSGPKAYVYAPSGSIMPIEAGTQFQDGRAKKITIDAVTFDAGGKDVVLVLR